MCFFAVCSIPNVPLFVLLSSTEAHLPRANDETPLACDMISSGSWGFDMVSRTWARFEI